MADPQEMMPRQSESLAVLIVDGDRSTRELIKARMQAAPGWSLRFSEVGDPLTALAKLREQVCDLVFLPCRPSDPQRFTLLEQIRQLHPKSAAIMIAPEANAQLTVAAMKKGAMDFLTQGDLPRVDFGPILHRLLEMRDLINQNMELGQVNQMKSLFISNVSRELRTPLTVIMGYARTLQDGTLGGLSAGQLKAVASIADRSEELLEMLNRILRVREAAEGRKAADFKLTDLREVCRLSAEKAKASKDMHSKRLRLEASFPEAPVPVMADPAALREVLDNVLSNAVKFSPERGIIRLAVGTDEAQAWANVQDQGAGIAPEVLPHIFEDFSSASFPSETRMHPGLGLGLALAKQTMVLHSGNIWLESPGPGQGCIVHISLPAAQEEPAAQAAAALAVPAAPEKRLVLIVDDNPDIIDIVRLFVAGIGRDLELLTARSGFEALDCLAKQIPDLIILDIMMPGMNGLELMERLKRMPAAAAVPILVLTGYADAAQRAREAGARDVLVKPFDHATFVKKVLELIPSKDAAPPA